MDYTTLVSLIVPKVETVMFSKVYTVTCRLWNSLNRLIEKKKKIIWNKIPILVLK